MTVIPRVEFETPVADGLAWGETSGVIFQEKFDGFRALLEWGKLVGRNRSYKLPGAIPPALSEVVLDGELVGGHYHVFDVLFANGREVSRLPLSARQQILAALVPHFPNWMHLVQSFANGGELLKAVLARGGEGIVRKELRTTWGYGWTKCKRQQTEDCVVLKVNPCSVGCGQYHNGQIVSVGNIPTMKDGIRVGDVVEVVCHSRHESGKLREAHVLRVRDDKPAAECTMP